MVTRGEAARIAALIGMTRDFRRRGAVGCAWTIGRHVPGLRCRVGLRMPNPIEPGRFYRVELGAGYTYDEALEAARESARVESGIRS